MTGAVALAFAAMDPGAAAAAVPASDPEAQAVIERVNALRASPSGCPGSAPAPALQADAALAAVDVAPGQPLADALRARGVMVTRAQAVLLDGVPSASHAMAMLRGRYCSVVADAAFSRIGVQRQGERWRIVVAEPLLAGNLGDTVNAGQQVLVLINAARGQPRTCGTRRYASAPPLRWNDRLAAAALEHSQDMAEHDYFRHEAPDGSEVMQRADRAGYRWRRLGENIASGSGSAQRAVADWLASPGHCANIMAREFTEMGAAYATAPHSEYGIYWTQVFGTPR